MKINDYYDAVDLKNRFKAINQGLNKYTNLIGIALIFLVLVLIVMTYINFDKQDQIIKTGGYTDGKIRCACSKEAYEQYEIQRELEKNNLSILIK